MDQLIQKLDEVFVGKAPALPDNVKEWIVKYGPWITAVLIVLFLPALLLALGISTALSPFAAAAHPTAVAHIGVSWVFLAVSLGLEVAALPGLFRRQMQGWRLLFYGVLVHTAYNLFSLNVGGLILGTAISLYILMQVRAKYA